MGSIGFIVGSRSHCLFLFGFQDACESIGVLPTIKVYIEELNREEFNTIRGISVTTKDTALFESKGGGSAKKAAPGSAGKVRKKASQEGYFRIKVKDNGCGMNHDKIPDLLGRVLSGSKYGVRQTRGKFGLGESVLSHKSCAKVLRVLSMS